jgi:hypothetical protein
MTSRHSRAAALLVLVLLTLTPCAADAAAPWQISLKTKFLFNSRTSYEFGNPLPPGQSPLSRLQFALDSVWAGFEARRDIGRASFGGEFLTSGVPQRARSMQDTDWDFDTNPSGVSDYSTTRNILRQSFQICADADVETADLIGLPEGFTLRPVAGVRWQHFSFRTHDGVQYSSAWPGGPVSAVTLSGDTIAFQQNWYMGFLGARLGYTWRRASWPRKVSLSTQGDLGYVIGKNQDLHLMRGARATYDHTTGMAAHALAGLSLGLTDSLDLGLEYDRLSINTTGSHRLVDTGTDISWDHGVRAWSEQSSATLRLTWRF